MVGVLMLNYNDNKTTMAFANITVDVLGGGTVVVLQDNSMINHNITGRGRSNGEVRF